MPYETVQYPGPATYDFEPQTEVSVHWGKESWVQINIQVHTDRSAANPGGPLANDPTVLPPKKDPIPVGSVKVNGDGTQVALKVAPAIDTGDMGEPPRWRVLWQTGTVEEVIESQIAEWEITSFGDGTPVATTVITNPLDRAEINKLIKALRKARDQAYGADA